MNQHHTIICPLSNNSASQIRLLETIDAQSICDYFKNMGIDVKRKFVEIDQVFKYQSSSGYVFFYPYNLEGDESLYNQLEKKEWYYIERKWEHRVAEEYILQGDSVLEIGCAEGSFLERLIGKNIKEVIGLELNKSAISKAHLKGINVVDQSIQQFNRSEKRKFDVICAFQVLEHIAGVYSFLSSVVDSLKVGGKLIISVPNNKSFIKWDKENPLNLPPHHMGLWDEKSLKYAAELFNLKVVKIHKEPLQSYHVDWYARVITNHYLSEFFNKAIEKLRVRWLLAKFVGKIKHRITGHSIMAIYEK